MRGFGIKLNDCTGAMDTASFYEGSVDAEFQEYSYGASSYPDEDEMTLFPVKYGRIVDPYGHVFEVLEDTGVYPQVRLVLNVLDLEESIKLYSSVLGMKLLRKRSNINSRPRHASLCAYMVRYLSRAIARMTLIT